MPMVAAYAALWTAARSGVQVQVANAMHTAAAGAAMNQAAKSSGRAVVVNA
jgi:hypothetical protein